MLESVFCTPIIIAPSVCIFNHINTLQNVIKLWQYNKPQANFNSILAFCSKVSMPLHADHSFI